MTNTNIKVTIEIDGDEYGFSAGLMEGNGVAGIAEQIGLTVRDTLVGHIARKKVQKVEAKPPIFPYPDPEPYKVYFDGVPARASGCEGAITRYGNRRKTFTNAFNQVVEYRYEPRPEYTNDPGRTK